MAAPVVHRVGDIEALSLMAASILAESAAEAIRERGCFRVALSGGATPGKLFDLVSSGKFKESIDWRHVALFWGDERCVGPEHEDSNYRLAYEHLISRVGIPPENVHRIKGELGPEQAAEDYERVLRKEFPLSDGLPEFDLMVQGIGPDGHTASLFPGSDALREERRPVATVFASGLWRVTLTLPVINNARLVLFLASGGSKSGVVRDVIKEGNAAGHPAGMVDPGRSVWLVDNDAASMLAR